jgi:hypothetical protein
MLENFILDVAERNEIISLTLIDSRGRYITASAGAPAWLPLLSPPVSEALPKPFPAMESPTAPFAPFPAAGHDGDGDAANGRKVCDCWGTNPSAGMERAAPVMMASTRRDPALQAGEKLWPNMLDPGEVASRLGPRLIDS